MFVQRQFQKYQKRSADEQQVSLLLKDFDDADSLLGRVRATTRSHALPRAPTSSAASAATTH